MTSESQNKLLARRFLDEVVKTGAVDRLSDLPAPEHVPPLWGIARIDQAREHMDNRLPNSHPRCGPPGAVLAGIVLMLTGCASLRPPTDQAPDYFSPEGYSRNEMMWLELESLRSSRPPSEQEMKQQMNKAMNDFLKSQGR
jgi:hypothetical protein